MPFYKVPFSGYCILKARSGEEARNMACERLYIADEESEKFASASVDFGVGKYFPVDDDEKER